MANLVFQKGIKGQDRVLGQLTASKASKVRLKDTPKHKMPIINRESHSKRQDKPPMRYLDTPTHRFTDTDIKLMRTEATYKKYHKRSINSKSHQSGYTGLC